MRSTYRALAGLIAVGVVVQAAFIALAWFTVLGDVEGGAIFDENTDYNLGQSMHAIIGTAIIPILALALLVVAVLAKIQGGVRWALIVLAVVVVQISLAFVSFGASAVGFLHGLNAFVLAGVAGRAASIAKTNPATTGASEPVAR